MLQITILLTATTPRLQLNTPSKRLNTTPKRPNTALQPTAAHYLSPTAFFIVLNRFLIIGKYSFLFPVVNQFISFLVVDRNSQFSNCLLLH